jgi:hypothetical protein
MRARDDRAPLSARAAPACSVSMVSSDLPEPDTPVMQVKVPSGILAVTLLQVVGARVLHDDLVAVALAALGGHRSILRRAGEVVGGEAALGLEDVLERALRDDLAAMDARARAEVDDVVGGADRVLVMLDDDHGVAEIAQAFQRLEQPVIVALVQADAGLIEHIEHARQPGADLRAKADALALAAGQACR